jgi:hypothetical protein
MIRTRSQDICTPAYLKKLQHLLGVRVGCIAAQKWTERRGASAGNAACHLQTREGIFYSQPYEPRNSEPQALEIVLRIVTPGKLV